MIDEVLILSSKKVRLVFYIGIILPDSYICLGYYSNHTNGPRHSGYTIHVICLIIKMTFLKLKFDHVISLLKILQKISL